MVHSRKYFDLKSVGEWERIYTVASYPGSSQFVNAAREKQGSLVKLIVRVTYQAEPTPFELNRSVPHAMSLT